MSITHCTHLVLLSNSNFRVPRRASPCIVIGGLRGPSLGVCCLGGVRIPWRAGGYYTRGGGGGTCQRECGSGCDPALSSAVAEYPMLTVPLVFLAVAALRSMGPHGHRCVETPPPPPPPGEAGCSLCLCGLAEQLMVGVGVPDDTAEACRDAKARDAPQGRGLKRAGKPRLAVKKAVGRGFLGGLLVGRALGNHRGGRQGIWPWPLHKIGNPPAKHIPRGGREVGQRQGLYANASWYNRPLAVRRTSEALHCFSSPV